MFDSAVFGVTLVSALGCGIVGGTFFAFSSFVMPALSRLPAAQGIAVMNSINVTVLTPWFMTPFVGTAIACVVLAIPALARWREPDAVLRLIGCVLYVVGSFVVTMVFNVPRNDALAAVDANGADGAAKWAQYLPPWTAWNTVRTVASLAAMVALLLALVVSRARLRAA
jgi:uncharacterized membrane protein